MLFCIPVAVVEVNDKKLKLTVYGKDGAVPDTFEIQKHGGHSSNMNALISPIKKILLINPPRVDGYPVERDERFEHKDSGAVYPPLSYLYVAAVLEAAGFIVKLIDASGFDIPFAKLAEEVDNFKPDLLFARIAFDCQEEDLKILEYAKARGVLTLTRNRIISEVPEIKRGVLARVHAFIEQDPDLVILEIVRAMNRNIESGLPDSFENVPGLSYLRCGEMVVTKPAKEADINSLPIGAYHLLGSLKPYGTQLLDRPFVSIYTSKGCLFGCSFCAYGKSGFRKRETPHIIRELEYLKDKFGLKSFLIFDDAFTLQREHAVSFCRELVKNKLNLTWSCCTRVDRIDGELLALMKDAGCREIAFGVESGSQKILDACHKGITTGQIKEAARICREAGIKFYCMIVLGLPGETEETIEETKALLEEIMPFYIQFCFAIPFPNTEIYSYFKGKGLLTSFDWAKYCPLNAAPICPTESMSMEALTLARNRLYRHFLFHPAFLWQHVKHSDLKHLLTGSLIFARKTFSLFAGKVLR